MPAVKKVWFWPSGGGLVDPEEDAFVRTAGRVGEAYSAAVADQQLASRHSEVRCFASHDPSVESVQVHIHIDGPAEGFLGGRVVLPDGIAALEPRLRASLVLEVFHTVLIGLGRRYRWSEDALGVARADASKLAGDFQTVTVWKSSPGRTWRARARFRLDDRGQGWAQLEVSPRSGDDSRSWRSAELESATNVEGFRKRTRIRWTGRDSAELTTVGAGTEYAESSVTFSPGPVPDAGKSDTGIQHDPLINAVPDFPVALIVHGAPESAPLAIVGGGGPMNDVPAPYAETVHWFGSWIRDNLADWWSQTGARNWYGHWDYASPRQTAPMVRLSGDRLNTVVRHLMPDPDAEADPVGSAYDDAVQLITRVQQRLHLPEPTPPLPTIEHVRIVVKSQIQEQKAAQKRVYALIQSLSDRLPPDWLDAVLPMQDGVPDGDLIMGLHNMIIKNHILLTDAEQALWQRLTIHDRSHSD